MRRLVLLGLLAALTLTLAPAASASTTSFSATFKESFGRATAHPCPADVFVCGSGNVASFGAATEEFFIAYFEPETAFETGCSPLTLVRTITLTDGSILVTEETGTVCFPGVTFQTPGSLRSFGNPGFFTGTYEIVEGTGVFEGATGSGTSTFKAAGDAALSRLSGTITLP
jgi:hypothetical protein